MQHDCPNIDAKYGNLGKTLLHGKYFIDLTP